ncbi:MAG: CCA tRNA nucleotidyltransferase, partial [Geopsychrobacter sp.]|nr:CCA tRNA nucleotidyltransferase [Geopsychrobacter sp.]
MFPRTQTVAWLVGGAVRDLLNAETPDDFDIAFAEDLTPLVKLWARRNNGHWFWLDKQRNQSRVVFVAAGLQFDFSALRAADISSDLKLRDFTLNAMALPLSVDPPINGLIDPLDGQNALKDGLLKGCSPGVFLDDPLRVLKGVRHVAERGWQVEPKTARLFVEAAPGLISVAGERIKSERSKIRG